MHWFLAGVWAGKHESGPADLCGFERDPLESEGQRASDFGAALEFGFLSGQYSGVALAQAAIPCCTLSNPDGVPTKSGGACWMRSDELNQITADKIADPETRVRIAQYEMAFRMQSSVPDLTDISKEPASTFELYGEDAKKGGTFANCCLMARRMMERDVRFVQVYHRGWDVHADLPEVLPSQCSDVDQGAWALVQDLKQRGLLDDTLVIWGGEFGRTIYSQGKLTATDYGRDHHPRCFSVWMAGAGIKGGVVPWRDGRVFVQHCQRSGTCPRFSSDHSESLWYRQSALSL